VEKKKVLLRRVFRIRANRKKESGKTAEHRLCFTTGKPKERGRFRVRRNKGDHQNMGSACMRLEAYLKGERT